MTNANTATGNTKTCATGAPAYLASFQYGPYGSTFCAVRDGSKYSVRLEDDQTPGTEDAGVAAAFDYLTERFCDVQDDDAARRLANKLDGSF